MMQENLIDGLIWCNSKDTDQTRLSVQADSTCAFAVSMQQNFLTFKFFGELSGSVVECLIQDRRAAGSSLIGLTVLWSLSKTHLSLLSTGSTQEDPSLFN